MAVGTNTQINVNIALSGLQLGLGLAGLYVGGGNWLSGACVVIAGTAAKELVSQVLQSPDGVISEIWKRVLPQSNSPFQGAKEKLKNAIVGAAIGYTAGNLPLVSSMLELGPFTLAALSGSAAYIYTDLQKPVASSHLNPSISAKVSSSTHKANILTKQLSTPIDVEIEGKTYQFDKISAAYDFLSPSLGSEKALFEAAKNAFWNNPRIVPKDDEILRMKDINDYPRGLGSILNKAAKQAKIDSRR